MKLLILNGPNLNMTGRRETAVYGTRSLDEIVESLKEYASVKSVETAHMQSNHEGVLIDALQKAGEEYDGVLLNAGALTHYSYSLRDAIVCCSVPVGEVHMSDITKREDFRKTDVICEVCAFTVMGLGEKSYYKALDTMTELLKK